jgi:murein DD-endopeptidase MepM/ murein hydrolase activator NlpD
MRIPHKRVGKAFATAFPEKTVSIRCDRRVLCFHLSPIAQGAAAFGLAALLLWTTAASSLLVIEKLGAIDDRAAIAQTAASYEARIATLEAESARMAGQLTDARQRSSALELALARRHEAVADAMADQRAVKTALEQLSVRHAALSDERDSLLAGVSGSASRIATLEAALAEAEADRRDLGDTLRHVALALDAAADARDGALADAELAEGALDRLEAGVEHQRDVQDRLLEQIEAAAERSIGSLEALFRAVGLDPERVVGRAGSVPDGMGGPFVPAPGTLSALPEETGVRLVGMLDQLERVAQMRDAALDLPLLRPVNNVRMTSGFGGRRDPINGRRAVHEGVDFAGRIGTPIVAPADGVVTFVGRQRGYGRLVKIRHENGFETRYAHLNRARVRVGQRVKRGERIADLGNTGRSTGPHLHYEIRLNGRPLNPMKFIRAAHHVL